MQRPPELIAIASDSFLSPMRINREFLANGSVSRSILCPVHHGILTSFLRRNVIRLRYHIFNRRETSNLGKRRSCFQA